MGKGKSAVITVLLSCLVLMGLTLDGYSQQEPGAPQSPAAQKEQKATPKKLIERPARYPRATAGLEVIADLSVSPSNFKGPCPAVFTFKGKISVNRPATVQYRFVRSDNVRHALGVLTFDKPGTQEVTDTWEFDDPTQLPTFKGWEAIQINLPMKIKSNVAYFEGTCTDYKGGSPARKSPEAGRPAPGSAPQTLPRPQPDPVLPPVKR
ncbi:MAG: hypothetical protein AB1512_27320 [Thermodesulfobacteriota bacterium]